MATTRLTILGFNPRLRAGGDAADDGVNVMTETVSIHASAREATVWHRKKKEWEKVSIHASAREATCPRTCGIWPDSCFNPRLRAGGDIPTGLSVSTSNSFNPRLRAGGDPPWLQPPHRHCRFQSTPPRGRRPRVVPRPGGSKLFQSTPPRGRRLNQPRRNCRHHTCFNPRLRAGGDMERRNIHRA